MNNTLAKPNSILKVFQRYPQLGTLIGLVVIVVFFSLSNPFFLTPANIFNLVNQTASIVIVAFGMTMILLTGNIDLSVGGVLALVGVISALLLMAEVPIPLIILIGLLVGCTVGLLNGLIVTTFGIQPFLVTMGTMIITRGLAQYATGGRSLFIQADGFRQVVTQGNLFGIPVLVYWVLLFAVVSYFLVSHTPFGRRMQAVGGNPEAAAYSGIKVKKVQIIVFIMSGFLASIAGFITMSRLSTAMPTVALGIEMDAIAAAVLGGTGFKGEGGSIAGTVLGALVIGTIINGLTVLRVDAFLQNVIMGIIIISAVIVSVTISKKAAA